MKMRKSIICHNYSKIVIGSDSDGYDFGDQRSYRITTKLPKRNIPSYYKLYTS